MEVETGWKKGGNQTVEVGKGWEKGEIEAMEVDKRWKKGRKLVESRSTLNVSPLQGSTGGGKKVENRWNHVPP